MPPKSNSTAKPAVWDCFMFNDEFDLLEIRLRLLESVVDKFVIFEGNRTFTGQSRSIALKPLPERFAPWADRILHHVVRLPTDADDPWVRENAQRAGMLEILKLADMGDLILLGDVDEFPRPELVSALATAVLPGPIRLEMTHCIFSVNLGLPLKWDQGTFALRTSHAEDRMIKAQFGDSCQYWPGYEELAVKDAGWHFSFAGQDGEVQSKLRDYSHQELNRTEISGTEHLQRCMALQVHFAGDGVLRLIPEAELTPLVEHVRRVRPALIAAGPNKATTRSHAYSLIVAMRRRGGPLQHLIEKLDRAPFVPFLAPLEKFRIRRRLVTAPWKKMCFVRITDLSVRPLD